MAIRPWATPAEVIAYSDRPAVKTRADAKLAIDIGRAEQYIIAYTNNRFEDAIKYPTIPQPVKTATILAAEAYANNAVEGAKTMKSETFDDYSYTQADTTTVRIESLDLGPLLDEFVLAATRGGVAMKLRKL